MTPPPAAAAPHRALLLRRVFACTLPVFNKTRYS